MTPAVDGGFTLIEALVAMAVLAVAAAGLIRATQAHIDLIAGLQARVEGGWAADNALAETRAGLVPAAEQVMLGHRWQVTIAARASDDPDVTSLVVTATDGRTVVTRRGFAGRPGAGRTGTAGPQLQ